ncbi:MAG TPA: dioxygenase [Usitatibacter sp.]|nr:dioxygenase [Usitatibacter sp.]
MKQPFRHGVVTGADSVTAIVQEAMSRTADPRLREIMARLVDHLHAFAREVKLTEPEWEAGVDFLRRIGQASGATKNEAMLLSDLLGLSTLVVLLNNEQGRGETDAALLGPFWRDHSPPCKPGESIARDPGGGEPLEVRGRVSDLAGKPVEGALVDVWQASPVGLYENQDEAQPDHNLRGRFETDADGRFHFRSVRPKGYPIPMDGPCGELVRAQGRHPYRPAHLHFMLAKEGYQTLVTQVFADDDETIGSDVVFGVTPGLSGRFERAGDGHWKLEYTFVMQPGTRRIPRAPIP